MKPQSAKAKGRNLQKWVRDMLLEHVDGRMTRQDIADYVAQVDTDVRDMIPQDLYRYATAK